MKKLLSTVIICFLALFVNAQPTYTFPVIPSTGVQLQNNDNVTSGYKIVNTTGIYNATLSGGTIYVEPGIVVGINLNINSGRIVIGAGSVVTLSNLNLNGSSSVYNRGALMIAGNGELQNSNDTLINESLFTVTGEFQFSSSTSFMINKGCVTFNTVSYHQGYLYSGSNKTVFASTFTSDMNNCLVGSFVLKIGNTLNIQNITSLTTSNIQVCTVGTINGTTHLGSATVTSTCSSCTVSNALPITLEYFRSTSNNLYWKFDDVSDLASCYLNYSNDAINWNDTSTPVTNITNKTVSRNGYYRLEMIATDHSSKYSNVIEIKGITSNNQTVTVYNLQGIKIYTGNITQFNFPNNQLLIIKSDLGSQKYFKTN